MSTTYSNNKNLMDKLMKTEKEIHSWLKESLTEGRYLHVIGAARGLAERFGADPDAAALAALLHDNAKCYSVKELLEMIKKHDIPVTEMELSSYKTLHAPVGAYIAQHELGVDDQDILNAIRYHSIGRIHMSLLEKIVFLADKIEENTRPSEFINKLKTALDETGNIDAALIICYDSTIRRLLDRRLFINTQTVDVYNELLRMLDSAT